MKCVYNVAAQLNVFTEHQAQLLHKSDNYLLLLTIIAIVEAEWYTVQCESVVNLNDVQ